MQSTRGRTASTARDAIPRFWRDDALPFIEARSVEDGRCVNYGKHTHQTFSIGAVTAGQSLYVNGRERRRVGAGTVVIINPEQVHACNPVAGDPGAGDPGAGDPGGAAWSYRMLHVDASWLAGLQHELGAGDGVDMRAFATTATTDPVLYRGLNHLYEALTDAAAEPLRRQASAVAFFSELQRRLDPAPARPAPASGPIERAADFIAGNCSAPLTLDDICAEVGLSPSYLIRAFAKRYGMTPHAYLVDRRIRRGQAQLKRGGAIADVALDCGFADQAHFQRSFKRLVAATPGQYRGRSMTRPDTRRSPPEARPSRG
ncbi:AraC family transcriptional regulator [Arenibaculum sp.]|uniref:AraC family transcriptional regulator n=1 Tax=Arenibaculum sp. TaxID=2865862 RepID=UPI002E0E2263|nr:AraC family transcriptional regulator [Arenibaculum sp.]